LLNLAGAWLGALMAFALEKAGAIARWSRFRERWFVPITRRAGAAGPVAGGTAVSCLGAAGTGAGAGAGWRTHWPPGWLETPFLEWVPVREVELQPLLPGAELLSA
jgi:hypothetical protein